MNKWNFNGELLENNQKVALNNEIIALQEEIELLKNKTQQFTIIYEDDDVDIDISENEEVDNTELDSSEDIIDEEEIGDTI